MCCFDYTRRCQEKKKLRLKKKIRKKKLNGGEEREINSKTNAF